MVSPEFRMVSPESGRNHRKILWETKGVAKLSSCNIERTCLFVYNRVMGKFEFTSYPSRKDRKQQHLTSKLQSGTGTASQNMSEYVEEGLLTIDNNMAENSSRPFVLGRKNWIFSGTQEGARTSALLYSLVETAKANNLEPYGYLRYIFTRLPLSTTQEDYKALLPWNIIQKQLDSAAGSVTGG